MNRIKPLHLSCLFLSILSVGCVVTDVGNPAIETEVEFAGHSSDAPEPTGLKLDNGVDVETALIKVRGFLLDDSSDCDATSDDFEGVVSVDLVSKTIVGGGPIILQRDAGDFCRLRLQFTTADGREEPNELNGLSLYVAGTTSVGTPFEVSGAFEDILSLEGNFTLDEGSHLLQVGFFLNEWFNDATFEDNATLDPDHPDYEVFRANVSTSARLFHDANNDGELDDTETARSLAAPQN